MLLLSEGQIMENIITARGKQKFVVLTIDEYNRLRECEIELKMPKRIFTHCYEKPARNFFKKHKGLLNQYEKTLTILQVNPHHPALIRHKLKGKLADLYSISINMQ
jgi:mRNA-degrading endonuclease YafQ of YafQ-DinJ toxin-antitoxin module